VNEKSSKTSLKGLFKKLLDQLQEGSGNGVEFVDYEKGLETVSSLTPLFYCSYSDKLIQSVRCEV